MIVRWPRVVGTIYACENNVVFDKPENTEKALVYV
jgi:hypothetical protein